MIKHEINDLKIEIDVNLETIDALEQSCGAGYFEILHRFSQNQTATIQKAIINLTRVIDENAKGGVRRLELHEASPLIRNTDFMNSLGGELGAWGKSSGLAQLLETPTPIGLEPDTNQEISSDSQDGNSKSQLVPSAQKPKKKTKSARG